MAKTTETDIYFKVEHTAKPLKQGKSMKKRTNGICIGGDTIER